MARHYFEAVLVPVPDPLFLGTWSKNRLSQDLLLNDNPDGSGSAYSISLQLPTAQSPNTKNVILIFPPFWWESRISPTGRNDHHSCNPRYRDTGYGGLCVYVVTRAGQPLNPLKGTSLRNNVASWLPARCAFKVELDIADFQGYILVTPTVIPVSNSREESTLGRRVISDYQLVGF